MDNEFKLEQLISQLGQVNDRIERLENVDYMTAMYKATVPLGKPLRKFWTILNRYVIKLTI